MIRTMPKFAAAAVLLVGFTGSAKAALIANADIVGSWSQVESPGDGATIGSWYLHDSGAIDGTVNHMSTAEQNWSTGAA